MADPTSTLRIKRGMGAEVIAAALKGIPYTGNAEPRGKITIRPYVTPTQLSNLRRIADFHSGRRPTAPPTRN